MTTRRDSYLEKAVTGSKGLSGAGFDILTRSSLLESFATVVILSKRLLDKALALRKCPADSKFRMSSCQQKKAVRIFCIFSEVKDGE